MQVRHGTRKSRARFQRNAVVVVTVLLKYTRCAVLECRCIFERLSLSNIVVDSNHQDALEDVRLFNSALDIAMTCYFYF